ncbi:uncharacterized mitochondrial protein AtMg00810-like [Phoenix dactylifera]|uniref:Uncharacterized mitochondrial protein AtMg00810-like n=1 Tax=Phoenix dactylifera TaxID=42345 RepID=A0A8B8ZT98_PHODC|nr:uncharacterized mitochondrial protein AtMg00810-like [Phoenix dactylifera]
MLIISIYVDDSIFTSDDESLIQEFKRDMMQAYAMSDLGLMHYFLGIEVSQTQNGIFISQKKYAEGIIKKFKMDRCKSVSTPLVANEELKKDDGAKKADAKMYRSLVDNFLYLTVTRPDIMFAANLLSHYMQEPSHNHYRAGKRVLRYLRGTLDYGILYKAGECSNLISYSDSDWAAEAEYIAAAKATSQAVWLRRILEDIGERQEEKTILFCDNKSAIAIGKNPINHDRTKIAIKYHFIREAIENGEIQLRKRIIVFQTNRDGNQAAYFMAKLALTGDIELPTDLSATLKADCWNVCHEKDFQEIAGWLVKALRMLAGFFAIGLIILYLLGLAACIS